MKSPTKQSGETIIKMKKSNYRDTLYLAIIEIIVSVFTVIGYLALGMFDWSVLSGALLGALVTVINFLILSFAINNAIDKYMNQLDGKKLDDEEAEAFAKANSVKVQAAVSKSYALRTLLMVGTFVLAFISKLFDPLATLIPLLMYKPAIYAVEFIKKKRGE